MRDLQNVRGFDSSLQVLSDTDYYISILDVYQGARERVR